MLLNLRPFRDKTLWVQDFRSRPLGLVPATELLWPLSPTVLWGLRMILIDFASLVTAPKEARPQALFRFSSTKARIAISAVYRRHCLGFRLQKFE